MAITLGFANGSIDRMHSMTFEVGQYHAQEENSERRVRIADNTLTPGELYHVHFPVSINVLVGEDDAPNKILLPVISNACIN